MFEMQSYAQELLLDKVLSTELALVLLCTTTLTVLALSRGLQTARPSQITIVFIVKTLVFLVNHLQQVNVHYIDFNWCTDPMHILV